MEYLSRWSTNPVFGWYGYMDPDQKTPVDADTLFELGSMSKDFPHAAAKVLEYQDSNQICLYIVANPRYRESGLRALLADKLLAYMIDRKSVV